MKRDLVNRVVLFETAGFAIILALLWLNEVVDLPHVVFRALPTPVNVAEAVSESVAVLLFALLVVSSTRRLVESLKPLELLLTICPSSKRIYVDDEWTLLEDYVTVHSGAVFARELCPACAEAPSPEGDCSPQAASQRHVVLPD